MITTSERNNDLANDDIVYDRHTCVYAFVHDIFVIIQ